jgi:quercetin dioxygenase-like cupin family protein/ligand-binding sensor protein
MRQETEWGFIDWEYLPDPNSPKRWFSIGIVNLLPGKHMPPHIHYSNEQFLYVLSGEVDCKFNGREYHAKAGDYFMLESDTTHEAYNNGTEVYRELMVTNPIPNEAGARRGLTRAIRRNEIDPELDEANRKKLNVAAENLRGTVLSEISVPYCLFDDRGSVIIKSDLYPPYCQKACDPVNNPDKCPCFTCSLADGRSEEGRNVASYVCPHGITVYLFPILREDRLVGILRGGHHFSSQSGRGEAAVSHPEYYDTPYGTEISIMRTLNRIVYSLLSYCDTLDRVEELEKQKTELFSSMQKNLELSRSLSSIEEKVTDMKINHHFLFNTLNCLAGTALTGDRMVLYSNIIDLSKMFRYSMATGSQVVPLSQELEYLRSYLNLQQMRYGTDLTVEYDVDPACSGTPVPFNFLQPIAENAFTHSFQSFDHAKLVRIRVADGGDRVEISSENNGHPPAREDLERIAQSWSTGSGHGLSFIYDKLRSRYRDDFDMEIAVTEDNHTRVTVRVPK